MVHLHIPWFDGLSVLLHFVKGIFTGLHVLDENLAFGIDFTLNNLQVINKWEARCFVRNNLLKVLLQLPFKVFFVKAVTNCAIDTPSASLLWLLNFRIFLMMVMMVVVIVRAWRVLLQSILRAVRSKRESQLHTHIWDHRIDTEIHLLAIKVLLTEWLDLKVNDLILLFFRLRIFSAVLAAFVKIQPLLYLNLVFTVFDLDFVIVPQLLERD